MLRPMLNFILSRPTGKIIDYLISLQDLPGKLVNMFYYSMSFWYIYKKKKHNGHVTCRRCCNEIVHVV